MDWEYEYNVGWQLEVVFIEWWDHLDEPIDEPDLWGSRYGSGITCHS